jgi:hypothetical protein
MTRTYPDLYAIFLSDFAGCIRTFHHARGTATPGSPFCPRLTILFIVMFHTVSPCGRRRVELPRIRLHRTRASTGLVFRCADSFRGLLLLPIPPFLICKYSVHCFPVTRGCYSWSA